MKIAEELCGAWKLSFDLRTELGIQSTTLAMVVGDDPGHFEVVAQGGDGWERLEDARLTGDTIMFVINVGFYELLFRLRSDAGNLAGTVKRSGSPRWWDPDNFAEAEVLGQRMDLPDRPLPVNVGERPHGAIDTYHPVIREGAPFPGYTVYRPAGPGRYPLVVWGNGGARGSNEEFQTFLSQVAAHGFVIIAIGELDARFCPLIGAPDPAKMTWVIDWFINDTEDGEGAELRHQIEGSKVAVMGQSAGAAQAWGAAAHPAVSSMASWNGGSAIGIQHPERRGAVHAPVLIVCGGPHDFATEWSRVDYEALPSNIPAVFVEHVGAGHIGLFHGTNDPQAALAGATVIGQEVEVQASTLAVHWLDYTLNGNKEAGRYFLGDDAWINRMWFWHATSKNIAS